jgi:uncharacterized small protein (DUF1192 family)
MKKPARDTNSNIQAEKLVEGLLRDDYIASCPRDVLAANIVDHLAEAGYIACTQSEDIGTQSEDKESPSGAATRECGYYRKTLDQIWELHRSDLSNDDRLVTALKLAHDALMVGNFLSEPSRLPVTLTAENVSENAMDASRRVMKQQEPVMLKLALAERDERIAELQGRHDRLKAEFKEQVDACREVADKLAVATKAKEMFWTRASMAAYRVGLLEAQLAHRHIVGKVYEVSRESINKLAGELDETRAELEKLRAKVK